MQGVQSLVQRAHRRGLVFVLSDLFAPLGYEEPLSALLHCQFEVQVLQVLALAGVRALLPSSDVAVIFAVDVSASISPEATKAAREFVGGALRAQRGGEHAGVVGFGKDAEVWQSPAEHAALADWPPVAADGRRRADLFNSQSSIGSPQSKGACLLPSAATDIGHALLSDGNDTAGHATGAACTLWRRSVDGGAAESRKPEVLVEREKPDGAPGGGSLLDLASAMAAAKIRTSVVGLGSEQDKNVAFLRQLAERGQGRFYFTADATTLPQIFPRRRGRSRSPRSSRSRRSRCPSRSRCSRRALTECNRRCRSATM